MSHPCRQSVGMTHHNRRSSSRPNRGRFTPRGFSDPDSRHRRQCGCIGCAAEARGEAFDPDSEWRGVVDVVARTGMAIRGVIGSAGETSWAYSIGRVLRGLPELIVVGMPSHQCGHLINHVADHWDRVISGELDDSVHLVPLPERVVATTNYVRDAGRFSREHGLLSELRVMQVVWPDHAGHFPWDLACDSSVRHVQPMLGLLRPTRT